jgi:DNA polymerase
MGIQRWELRAPAAAEPPSDGVELPGVEEPQAGSVEMPGEWATLNARIRACTRCGLHESRTQAVFGVGNTSAECLIIGEAPGAEEDRQGEPFVGRAGQLLDAMLAAIGLDRRSVFIANILKCRPPNNRDPKAAESAACMAYLHEQIGLLKPRLIIVVGKVAAQNLLNNDLPIGRMRETVYRYGANENDPGIPVVVTYHPAYLLRSPAQKAKSWADLLLAQDILDGADI